MGSHSYPRLNVIRLPRGGGGVNRGNTVCTYKRIQNRRQFFISKVYCDMIPSCELDITIIVQFLYADACFFFIRHSLYSSGSQTFPAVTPLVQ